MNSMISISAELREENNSNAIRRDGYIPAIIYGDNKTSIPIAIKPSDIIKEVNSVGFFTKVFELNIQNKSEKVIAKNLQMHPVKDYPVHIDFMRVNNQSKINILVPIEFINELQSPGLKRGGILNIILHKLRVDCSIDKIPEKFVIDLKGLEVGESLNIEKLNLPEGVKPIYSARENVIATIVSPKISKVKAEESSEKTEETDEKDKEKESEK